MAAITDKDRSVFRDAAATVLDNFTQEEQQRTAAIASELQTILTAAKGATRRDSDRCAERPGVWHSNTDARGWNAC